MNKPSSPTLVRILPWKACINVHELGGYPVLGGGHTRWRALVRSDNFSRLKRDGQRAVLEYGIRTIIDLRFADELVSSPNPFEKHWAGGPDYLNIPMDEDVDLVWPTELGPAEAMCQMYRLYLEKNRKHIAGVLSAIAHAQPGGVVYHCHAGKDRTGIITAMVMGAIGVPDDVIAMDYAMSYDLLRPMREKDLTHPGLTEEKREYLRVLHTALPETILGMMKYVKEQYGGVTGYLATTPFPMTDLELLRQRLVE